MAKKIAANMENAVSPKQDIENDYETQNHLDTLIRAHGIMSDAGKMAKVHKLAGRHHKAIKGIQDIKDRYNEMVSPKPNKSPSVGDLMGGDQDKDGE